MRFGYAQLTTNGSMSSGFTSFGIDLQQEATYSIQAIWTSTSSASSAGLGTMKLQVSNDNPAPPLSGPPGTDPAAKVVNWSDFSSTLASTSLTTGTSNFVFTVYPASTRWVRFVYVAASGTGIMNVQFFGKGY